MAFDTVPISTLIQHYTSSEATYLQNGRVLITPVNRMELFSLPVRLDARLDVEARVETEPGADGEPPLPAWAELRGPYSQDLADWIAGELGIPAERQVWHEGKN